MMAQDLAGNIDLVVKGKRRRPARGWVYDGGGIVRSDRWDDRARPEHIAWLAGTVRNSRNWVPPDSGAIGIDRTMTPTPTHEIDAGRIRPIRRDTDHGRRRTRRR